ncbi:Rossmann fold domain-containing protein [uncultured Sphingomonas sp.]|uniref:Rossmann fold domain-containing protein n=1 Tax=uncultured Sphingomonas sp. TaxID=158754 RepID=UPI0035CA6E90
MRIAVGPGDDVAALVRAADAESVLVLIDPALDPLAAAQVRAAIGPLAVERAPNARVNALLPAPTAHPPDIEAAMRFLEGARSVTGQLLEVAGR